MYVYLLGAGKGFPTKEAPQAISDGINRGWIELTDDDISFGVPSAEDEEKRDHIWEMMGEALTNEPAIFEKD
jgi:hypothetical protein